eukprot:scaffold39883_cov36-Tisochrysis_lutea.AAC.3
MQIEHDKVDVKPRGNPIEGICNGLGAKRRDEGAARIVGLEELRDDRLSVGLSREHLVGGGSRWWGCGVSARCASPSHARIGGPHGVYTGGQIVDDARKGKNTRTAPQWIARLVLPIVGDALGWVRDGKRRVKGGGRVERHDYVSDSLHEARA